jgi:NAD(P)-dependent dehydrogenase (short-subunit alcohol dehydrogenase family)
MALSIDLTSKVVVICGAGGDIGAAVSNATCAAGAQLLVVDRTADLVEETMARVSSLGGTARGLVADLSEAGQSGKVVASARKEFGRVDGVVNVAGGTKPDQWCRFEETPDEMFRSVFRLNFDYIVTGYVSTPSPLALWPRGACWIEESTNSRTSSRGDNSFSLRSSATSVRFYYRPWHRASRGKTWSSMPG